MQSLGNSGTTFISTNSIIKLGPEEYFSIYTYQDCGATLSASNSVSKNRVIIIAL